MDAWYPEADEGEGHGHAVVVSGIGLDSPAAVFRPAGRGGPHPFIVAILEDLDGRADVTHRCGFAKSLQKPGHDFATHPGWRHDVRAKKKGRLLFGAVRMHWRPSTPRDEQH